MGPYASLSSASVLHLSSSHLHQQLASLTARPSLLCPSRKAAAQMLLDSFGATHTPGLNQRHFTSRTSRKPTITNQDFPYLLQIRVLRTINQTICHNSSQPQHSQPAAQGHGCPVPPSSAQEGWRDRYLDHNRRNILEIGAFHGDKTPNTRCT